MVDKNRGDFNILIVILAVVVVLIGVLVTLGGPLLQEVAVAMAPGIGLKTAAMWGFGVTIGLFVLFATVAGDGLFGEIQFMLGSFFAFFAVISLLIAWVF